MAKRQKASISEMKVGIVVTISLLMLAAVILQQSWDINWFTRATKVVTYLPDVGGLKPGAPVWLAGIEIGKVTRVSIVPPEVFPGNTPVLQKIGNVQKQLQNLDPKIPNYLKITGDLQDNLRDLKSQLSFVEIQLQIRDQYFTRISRDSEVSIGSKGLIGDSFIEITPGTYGTPPTLRADSYMIEGVRTTGFREIMTGANDVIANFGVLSEQFKNIALKINPEKVGNSIAGTVQDLQTTMQQAQKTFEHATTLVDDLRGGEGTVAKLISDPAAYDHLVQALDRFNKIADQIQNGTGTLPKLIQNPALFDNANESLRKVDGLLARIEKGEGTLGKLSKDSELYDKTKVAIDQFATLMDQINKGEGTLGKLAHDPALYNNLNQSTAEITKLIYDLRKDPKKYLTIHFRLF
jgi:phospholipid/cholesterol/gamma-HCH transport system substrate-binding protein